MNNGVLLSYWGKDEDVTIPNSVTSIGEGAFSNCTSLTSITIPNTVTSIGEGAFYECDNLTIYGYSGSAAEKYANENGIKFKIPCQHSNTARFEKVEPQSCTQPGYTAGTFCNDCKQWIEGHEEITVPHTDKNSDNICDVCSSNLKEIIDSGKCGNNAVYVLYGDGELVISGKGEISEGAFDSYYRFSRSVIKVNIENGITGIGDYAFDYSEKISSIIIPDSVESIGESAFYGCTGLTSITIPNSVTSIGDYAFYDCTGLRSVTIPNSVTSIGYRAFCGCRSLTSIKGNYKACKIKNDKFCCRDTTFKIGEWAAETEDIELCERGYHFCTNLFDIFNYYYEKIDKDIAIFICETGEKIEKSNDDSKCVTNKIKLVRRLSKDEIISLLNGKEIEKDEKRI